MMDIIDRLLDREGGYVDHPADRGGPTKYGITLATLSRWRGRRVSPSEVRRLTRADAREIYMANYVLAPGFDRIRDRRLAEQVIDAGVMHGPRRAARWLQRAAEVDQDGLVGPLTLAAVNAGDPETLARRFAAYRIRFIGRVISRDPTQAAFAAGWLARATLFLL